MSEEFIQFRFPCNECLVQAACKDRKRVKQQVKEIMQDVPSLGVPRFKNKSYYKGLIECLINIQKQVVDKVSRNKGADNKQEQDNLPMQYVHLIISMSDILCHMINSTSWREGELFEFDRMEIKQRLTQLERWL